MQQDAGISTQQEDAPTTSEADKAPADGSPSPAAIQDITPIDNPSVTNDKLGRISHRHEAIINWLITYPDRSLRDCSAYFGVSQSWLSVVIHSDIFQEKLRQRQEEVFSATVQNIRTKLEGVAHVALDRLGEMVDSSSDADFILDAADRALHRLGYAPQPKHAQAAVQNTQVNINVVDSSTLAEARSLMERARTIRIAPQATLDAPALPETANESGG